MLIGKKASYLGTEQTFAPERTNEKKQLFTQEATNDAGEEIQLAILRTAALVK